LYEGEMLYEFICGLDMEGFERKGDIEIKMGYYGVYHNSLFDWWL